jgi:magnesium transporter
MNFTYMPELDWRFGYPMAVAGMVVSGFILYRVFKHRHWL